MPQKQDAIYLRKSRADMEAEAHGEGETLARHERTLLDLAASRGYTIGKIYREIVTADTIDDRPQMQALLRDVQYGLWRAVLVMETSRLARGDSIDQGIVANAFRYSNTLIITPINIFDPQKESDNDNFELNLFMSRWEYTWIKRRLLAGRQASVTEGKYMGTRPPFGYRRYKLPNQKGWSLEVYPEQAEIVRMVFDMYVNQGLGTNTIARRIDAMGARSMFGHKIDACYVRNILRNPAYIGKVQWNKRTTVMHMENGQRVKSRPLSSKHILVDGMHEPLVTREIFEKADQLLSSRHTRPVNFGKSVVNPLAGLVVCSKCGRGMVRKNGYRANKTDELLFCPNQYCDMASTQLHVVESVVLNIMRSWLANPPQEIPEPDAAPSTVSTERAALERQLETLSRQLTKAQVMLEQDVYTVEEFIARRQAIRDDMASTKSRLAELAKASSCSAEEILANLERVRSVLDVYDSTSSPEEKNDLLRSVVSKITYAKTRRCFRNDEPGANLSISVIPAFPICR